MSGAIDSTTTCEGSQPSGSGSVLVSTTRSKTEVRSRSVAGVERTPWVAMAHTSVAPSCLRRSAAATIVPAVSIMSSRRMQRLPATLPITLLATTVLAWPLGRSLFTNARSAPRWPLKRLAAFTPPASGATITRFSRSPWALQ